MALSDLTTKGFCVIKNLFSAEQVELIKQDFELIKDFKVNEDYPVLPVGKRIPLADVITNVVDPLSLNVLNDTGITTDFNPTPVYFSINHGVNFDWHQDHESYLSFKDHLNYLNIYVAIYKDDPKLSNICVLDFEKLIEKDPQMSFLKGYGATRFVVKGDKTILTDDNTGIEYTLDFDINTIADCPNLESGDAIVMRGDCIHRTQDTLTPRVAMSVRRMNSKSIVKRSNFTIDSQAKQFVFSNKDVYNKMLSAFGNAEEIELGKLVNVHTGR